MCRGFRGMISRFMHAFLHCLSRQNLHCEIGSYYNKINNNDKIKNHDWFCRGLRLRIALLQRSTLNETKNFTLNMRQVALFDWAINENWYSVD